MSTNRNFDKICCVVLAFVILITVAFCNGEKLGLTVASRAMGYETKLFDTSTVHTINIIMDDWDAFLETCTSEEYSACSLVIDNEAYKNVAIRGKGNTSLSNVKNYGNNRYSFKVEFDKYDKTKTYHGLDKLCLNNIIQDNTYMKDYLVYQMMKDFGVNSPLCSYVYLTVNGEDWGLYLAVEGVEDSFLQRNYGNDDVNLYKPDSMSMGGGKGNGKEFDMDKFNEEQSSLAEENTTATNESGAKTDTDKNADTEEPATQSGSDSQPSGMPSMPQGGSGGFSGESQTNEDGETVTFAEGEQSSMPSGGLGGFSGEMPTNEDGETVTFDADSVPSMPSGGFGGFSGEMPTNEDGETVTFSEEEISSFADKMGGGDKGGMGGGMGSDDVKLEYTDDEFDSYSNIFDNAKTDISDSDKETLISSLKSLNSAENLEEVVDIEQVIRYFVVHNFVLNGDSYTGSMIHNYYLTENDGTLAMVPWDYNLAFGGFQSMGGAEELVNSPIDSPVSGGSVDDRPMLAWILNSEEYTAQYHELFSEFITNYFDSGKFETEIDRVKEMISPYVEKDPTKFCTYDEFITGIDTLKEFCLLRAESVSLQLDGTIGSTEETQTDTSNFVKADDITISDMGSMGNNGGGGDMGGHGGGGDMQKPDGESDGGTPPTKPDGDSESGTPPTMQEGETSGTEAKTETETQSAKAETESTTVSVGTDTEKKSDTEDQSSAATQSGSAPQIPSGESGDMTPPSGENGGGTPPSGDNGDMTPPGNNVQMPNGETTSAAASV